MRYKNSRYPDPGCDRDGQCGVNPWCGGIDDDGVGTCGYCGGSIVASKFVITAGHCVESYKQYLPRVKEYGEWIRPYESHEISVRVGDTNLNSTDDDNILYGLYGFKVARFINVKKIHRNTEWIANPDGDDKEVPYDIAILELEEEVNLHILTPACLPRRTSFTKFDGKAVNVVGWGLTKEKPVITAGKAEYTAKPHEVKLTVTKYNSSHHDTIINTKKEGHEAGDCGVSCDTYNI